jgi:hypothetical protein
MADIYQFPIKRGPEELDRLRAKLVELEEARDAVLREMRITKDLIKLLENGEKKS